MGGDSKSSYALHDGSQGLVACWGVLSGEGLHTRRNGFLTMRAGVGGQQWSCGRT